MSKIANERYLLGALSAVVPLNDCVRELEQLAQSVQDGQNRYSGFNPLSPEATKVFEAILDGSHSINGFRNKDLRKQLFGDTKSAKELTQISSKTTRIIRKLRAHRLISKIPRSTRYKVTEKGYRILGASLKMKKKYLPMHMKNAAFLVDLSKWVIFFGLFFLLFYLTVWVKDSTINSRSLTIRSN